MGSTCRPRSTRRGVHFEEGLVYVEPGVDTGALDRPGVTFVRFPERNLFFGGAQAVQRDPAPARCPAGAIRAAAGAVAVA